MRNATKPITVIARDYAGRPPGLIEQVSPHIELVIDGGDDEFGACDICDEPAGLVVPWDAAISGQRRFAGPHISKGNE
jgi:hypothetical protein